MVYILHVNLENFLLSLRPGLELFFPAHIDSREVSNIPMCTHDIFM